MSRKAPNIRPAGIVKPPPPPAPPPKKGQDQHGVKISRNVHRRLKILSVELEVSMGQIVEWAVEEIEKDLKLVNVPAIKQEEKA